MKFKIHLLVVFILGLFALTSCETTSSKLVVESQRICLNSDSTKSCQSTEKSSVWLHLERGKIVLDTLNQNLPTNPVVWRQFGEPMTIKDGEFIVTRRRDTLTMINPNLTLTGNAQLGFVFTLNSEGEVIVFTAQTPDCFRVELAFEEGGITRNGASMGTAMTIRSEVLQLDDDQTAIIEKIVEGDIAARTMANDTGTEVVIVDGFKTNDNSICCDYASADCCGEGRSRGGNARQDATELSEPDLQNIIDKSYATLFGNGSLSGINMPRNSSAWKTLLNLDSSKICAYEYCHYLVVVNCETGEIWCYDTTECTIMIRLNPDGTVSIQVPNDCAAFDNQQACNN